MHNELIVSTNGKASKKGKAFGTNCLEKMPSLMECNTYSAKKLEENQCLFEQARSWFFYYNMQSRSRGDETLVGHTVVGHRKARALVGMGKRVVEQTG